MTGEKGEMISYNMKSARLCGTRPSKFRSAASLFPIGFIRISKLSHGDPAAGITVFYWFYKLFQLTMFVLTRITVADGATHTAPMGNIVSHWFLARVSL